MSNGAQRRLVAILAADVVGYSRLIAADEVGTLAAMRSLRSELWDPTTEAYGGRLVGTAGDSRLVEFPSAVAAVECAVAIQRAMVERNADVPVDRRIQVRIGINLGDVVVDGKDIHGDGVNIAARLESEAGPSGICISDDVMRQVRGRLDLKFTDGGEQVLKNIAQPVRIWHWATEGATGDAPRIPLTLPDKPSIAVLPFDNMSGDPAQEFFADGIAEDVITALSRFGSLFVIARNSSFTYKGAAVDIARVGRELGVRYVVEGSVRKAGNRLRVTAQLIDATSGNHLWADRFEGGLDDIFDLQDRITEQIVVVIEPAIGARERERARRKPPDSLDAWELLQRGLSHLYRINKTDHAEAVRLFKEAVALDSEFAAVHAHLAHALSFSVLLGYGEDTATAPTLSSARAAAERAVFLDLNEPLAHFTLGRLHMYSGGFEMAIGEMQTAIALNPNFALGHHGLGWTNLYGAGQAAQALPHLDAALRLSPRDPMRWLTLMVKGWALRALDRQDEAIAYCRQACRFPDPGFRPYMHLAAALAKAGREGEAQTAVKQAMQLEPALSIDYIKRRHPGIHEAALKSLLDGLQLAGMPS